MRPSMSMYAKREAYDQAMFQWAKEVPTLENEKMFMVFEGEPPDVDNFLFEGTIAQFDDAFFSSADWDHILSWANDYNYTIVYEGTRLYEDISEQLNMHQETYDADGNQQDGGLYDAGGNLIPERLAEYADYMRDKLKDE